MNSYLNLANINLALAVKTLGPMLGFDNNLDLVKKLNFVIFLDLEKFT